MADANIRAVITAKDDASATLNKFNDNLRGTSSEADKAANSFGQLTKAFVFGNVLYSVGANTVVKVRQGIADLVKQADEAAKSQQQLNAVIASTGGVAGVTARAANELADSIRNNSTIDNDAALQAENMLLTFRDIGKDIFPTATKAVADMATAMNGGATPSADELRKTALQVGKALQDPILGVTTLRRVGVQLSDQQQQQVKDFIAVNDKASAQKVILNELGKEFGGSAAATADTFSGKLQQVRNRLDDLGKGIILNIETTLNNSLPSIEKFVSTLDNIFQHISIFLSPSLTALGNVIATQLYPAVVNLINALQPGLTEVLKVLGGIIGLFVIQALKDMIGILVVLINILSSVINVVAQVIAWFGNLWTTLVNFAKNVGNAFMGVEKAISGPFMRAFNDIKNGIEDIEKAFDKMEHVVTGGISGVRGVLHAAHIPGFAGGVTNFGGGLAVVGEKGPELVNLPSGSSVIPNNKISAGSPTQISITVQAGAFMGNPQDARQYAKLILSSLQDVAESKSLNLSQLFAHNAVRSL